MNASRPRWRPDSFLADPGKHRTLFYGHYANDVRGDRAAEEPAKKRRCTASWARLVAEVLHADPLIAHRRRRLLAQPGVPGSTH